MKFIKRRKDISDDGWIPDGEEPSHSMWSLKKIRELLKRKGLC